VNPADEAAVQQAKFNAREAKRQAGLLMDDIRTNALRFNEQAEQQLAQGVAILGKTGNLGSEKSEAPSTGIALGDANDPAAELYDKTQEARAQRNRSVVPGPDVKLGVDVASITAPDSLLYASGSDLLTMTSLRDKMERDKRSLIRKGQSEAYSMLLAGENFTEQAGYAREAANYNMWSTILGGGIRLGGAAAGLGLFG
jgi:hypothetical protein